MDNNLTKINENTWSWIFDHYNEIYQWQKAAGFTTVHSSKQICCSCCIFQNITFLCFQHHKGNSIFLIILEKKEENISASKTIWMAQYP